MKNYNIKYFEDIKHLDTIEIDQVIAKGDGDFITKVAEQVSEYFGYDSMWLFAEPPVFKPNRTYLLWFDGNFITVSKANTKVKIQKEAIQ